MLLINKQLLKLGKRSWGWIGAIVLTKVLILLSMIYVVVAVAGLISSIGGAGAASVSTNILLAIVSSVIGLLGNLALGELKFYCTANIRIKLRHTIYQKILELEMNYVVKMGTSKAVTASIDGIEALEKYYSEYLPDLIYCMIAPFILFFRISPYSEKAAWVLLILSVLVIPANSVFKKLMTYLRTDYWDTFDSLNEYFLESLEGMTILKLMNRDRDRLAAFKKRAYGYYEIIVKTMRISFLSTVVTQAFIYGGMLWSTIIVIGALQSGAITAANAFLSLMLAYAFFNPVKDLINTGHTAMNGVAAASNLVGLLGIQPSVPEKVEGEKANCGRSGIVIENVAFSYDKNRTVLDKVCIDVPKGSTVALCGQSGCGKSTLVNLVMHFNEPASGDIYLDGTNLRNISHAALRKNVTLVPQSTYIFSGTVEDNLRIVDKSLTEERMLQALKQVKLESLIEKEGLKTDVGENGSKLSGGQKQKIGIARAILSDCEYMVFDEATSSVDAESEEDIWNCIHDISKEKTLLIISHRLSTIRNADRIYVLDHGSVVESGKHAELMKNDSIYAKMVQEQDILENYGRRETSERN